MTLADSLGRLTVDTLLTTGTGYLVALDARTGDRIWEKQVDFPCQHIIYFRAPIKMNRHDAKKAENLGGSEPRRSPRS
ncbi:hypothetical protein AMJ85_05400 [candidate division BRC1 bacterium SM23_51]|nr:MAG: hypothetical protein AMJ85_05400 [candidate division BRC1 bacterium SM23_51]